MQTYDLKAQLEYHFGYHEFREGQRSIIEDILSGHDALGVLPTGTGKSICFQLPTLLQSGITIVVSPLISLMVDQVKQLKANGYKGVVALNSFMDRTERIKTLKQLQQYKLIYISPEMLQNDWVKSEFMKLSVDLFVIDEAHCISQWGHEFRTDYLKLDRTIESLGHPTVLALSATATPDVQVDIMDKLNRPQMIKHIYAMDKQNISLLVEHYQSPEQKVSRIKEVLKDNKAPTMIYFSSKQWAERVAEELDQILEQRVAFYHGGMEQTDRMLVQQQFMNQQLDVICCTSAFGMGVDKRNIRLVIHFHVPTQLESFIQEIGRAGRDGKPCMSLVLFTPRDQQLPQMLIQSELPEDRDISNAFRILTRYQNEEGVLPEDSVIAEELQLSESQWNFIRYQLEKYSVIDGRTLTEQSKDSQAIQGDIIAFLEHRWAHKQSKLTEILQWIHHPECKRIKLYEPFQETIRPADVPCCNHCDTQIISKLNFKESAARNSVDSWQERLREVFNQGVDS